ncbi:MAG TPA: sugar ABC transporter permease [Ktedonobacteraceae bacterium]|jgi:multiple sugar transport system permease protein|nr:sugar ABC transporter permease [Ktedonobacteraceae bacterium]
MFVSAKAKDVPGQERRSAASSYRARSYKRRFPWIRATFLIPAILYIIVFYGYPLAYSIVVSFQRYDLQAEIRGSAAFIGLTNYISVYGDPIFQQSLWHTVLFTVGSIVPQFLIGLALAVFFYRRFPLSTFLRSLILLPWLIPLVVGGTVWRWLFDQTNGILDQILSGLGLVPAHFGWLTTPTWSLVAIIIANIWIGIPFNTVILYSGLQGISRDFYEAASLDGAGKWQIFRYVTLPLLRPVIGVVLILGLIYTLKVFDIIYIMTGGGPANDTQIFATWSYNLSFSQQLFGQGAALGNTIMLIAIIVALVYLWRSAKEAA